MKKIAKVLCACLMGMALVSVVSCGSKVDQKELNKKIEASLQSDEEPEFTDAEYQFMADYLLDNFDKIEKMDYNDKDAEMAASYVVLLGVADFQGKLDKGAKAKYEQLQEKIQGTAGYKTYKENEKVIMDELQNADIDWDQAFEEAEADFTEE